MREAYTAIKDLIKESFEWRRFFKLCCQESSLTLRSQAWQFRDELAERGHSFAKSDIEDVLLSLARELLPESPAAQWDEEWANALVKDAFARLAEHGAGLSTEEVHSLDLSGPCKWEKVYEAKLNNDPAAYRAAIRQCGCGSASRP